MEEELDSEIIAIPIKVKISRSVYGYFMGECYIYFAKALGVTSSGNTPGQAIQRLTEALTEKLDIELLIKGH